MPCPLCSKLAEEEPSKRLDSQKKRWWASREAMLVKNKEWRETEVGKACLKKCNKTVKNRNKVIVIDHYSNGQNKCACCHESTFEFLTIDHIDNDGFLHRKTGSITYHRLIKEGFPTKPRLQVLCFNCNLGKRVGGGVCPHQRDRELKALQLQSQPAEPLS